MRKSYLLTPDLGHTYGQDFLSEAMLRDCGLSAHTPGSPVESLGTASLVVSQNPDSKDEADLICGLPSPVTVVIHVHCQYTYFDAPGQENIARCASRAAFGITPARFSMREFAKNFPTVTWRTVYNGVDTGRFRPSNSQERRVWRDALGIPADRLLVGFVGRLTKSKGLQVLEEFVRLLADTQLHLLLQFPKGDSKYYLSAQRIHRSDPGRVTLFPDYDLNADRPVRYFDLLVTPSLSEVCPLVVLEAFQSGVPVLATNATPFFHELEGLALPHDYLHVIDLPALNGTARSGLSLSPYDATQLARRSVTIAAGLQPPTDDYRTTLSQSTVQAGFAQQHMLASFNRIYREAISSR